MYVCMNPRWMIQRGAEIKAPKNLSNFHQNPQKIPGSEINWNPQNSEPKKFPSTVNLF